MSRNCLICGVKFNESIFDKEKEKMIFDKIPECWKNGKESGHCVKCCKCYN